MRIIILALIIMLFPLSVSALQVCLDKSTGKLLEFQTHATPGTCTRNLINAGIPPGKIIEKEVTKEEWAQIKETWINLPNRQRAAAKKAKRDAALSKLSTATGLTVQEIKEALDIE